MIVIATLGGYIARLLKQPLIPAYILLGFVLGPEVGQYLGGFLTNFGIENFSGVITNPDLIFTLSQLGIAFFLFIVGLELDFKKLKNIGFIATIGTPIQVLLMFILGFVVSSTFFVKILSNPTIESIYIGLIVAFSSTVIVVKLLTDRRELDTLHGRIIIGILIVQDIFAILALSILPNIGVGNVTVFPIVFSLLKAIGLIIVAMLLSKYIFPHIFKFAAKSHELLYLSALSVCFIFGYSFEMIGLSIPVGAFVGGFALANLPYNLEMISSVKSLKDFFATLFFVSLGMMFTLKGVVVSSLIMPLIVLTLLVIIVKPLIIMFICAFFSYTERTLFSTAISLSQISEFSIIIVTIGYGLGHVSSTLFAITVLLAMITIISTTYFVKYYDNMYRRLSKFLAIFGRRGSSTELEYIPDKLDHDVILIGYDRIGYSIYKTFEKMGKSFLVVDFNPDIVRKLAKKKVPCIYGDISDLEILHRLNLKKAELIVSTAPDLVENKLLIKLTREVNKKARIFVTANQLEDAMELYKYGADYVILPHFLGGERVATIIEDFPKDKRAFNDIKKDYIKILKERIKLGHEHPKNGHKRHL
ncbi:cation:proton antiporter [Nanoarchaeota archaeon]